MPTAAPVSCARCQQAQCRCPPKKHNWDNKQHRGKVQKLYNCKRWRDTREQRLRLDGYLCVEHKARKQLEPATTVDHIQSVGSIGLERFIQTFYELSKLQSLCDHCHRQKTSRYDSKQG